MRNFIQEYMVSSQYFAPRGKERLMFLGEQISHRHINYDDKIIGIVGDFSRYQLTEITLKVKFMTDFAKNISKLNKKRNNLIIELKLIQENNKLYRKQIDEHWEDSDCRICVEFQKLLIKGRIRIDEIEISLCKIKKEINLNNRKLSAVKNSIML